MNTWPYKSINIHLFVFTERPPKYRNFLVRYLFKKHRNFKTQGDKKKQLIRYKRESQHALDKIQKLIAPKNK